MSRKRIKKINELVKREISQIILREIEFPEGALITVINVETSIDLLEAKIWISVFPINKSTQVIKILLKKIGHLQSLLNRRLIMYHSPRIKFLLDKGEESVSRIENILNKK